MSKSKKEKKSTSTEKDARESSALVTYSLFHPGSWKGVPLSKTTSGGSDL